MADSKSKVTARAGEEVWELTTGGAVWVKVLDSKGVERDKSVKGRGSRLRLSTADRQIAQERIRKAKNDPFTNGTLILLAGDEEAREETASPSALTDEELLGLLAKKQSAPFKKSLEELSEVAYRRLRALLKDNDDVTALQQKALQEVYDANYNPNKDWVDPGGDGPEAIASTFPEVNLSSGAERKH